ncbi:MAG: hypothetical protein ABIJ21_06555 [Nanoarchaeota archaeon]
MEDLYARIQGEYDYFLRHIPLISSRGRLVGEIDLVGVWGERVDIFEVKCSFRIIKARRQLQKIRKYIGKNAGYYFYCGTSKTIECIT